jgi:hypothetical protein
MYVLKDWTLCVARQPAAEAGGLTMTDNIWDRHDFETVAAQLSVAEWERQYNHESIALASHTG